MTRRSVSKKATEKKWIAMGIALTLSSFLFGVWLFIFPSWLQNQSSDVNAKLGIIAVLLGIVAIIADVKLFLDKKLKSRTLLIVLLFFCSMAILSGLFAYAWHIQPGLTW